MTNMSKKKLIKQMNLELTNKARKNKFKQDKKQFKANLQKKMKTVQRFPMTSWVFMAWCSQTLEFV